MPKHLSKLAVLVAIIMACQTKQKLPYLGQWQPVTKTVNGKAIQDSVAHQIAPFGFFNQDSVLVTEKDFAGKKIYVADFFFTSCPTICPKMKGQMLRLYQQFKDTKELAFLSHSIDPRHDTVPVLKAYASKLGVNTNQWQFVTGPKEKIYEIAQKSYMTSALEDKNAAGGFVHSGAFVLVDKQLHVRGIYDGTLEDQVDKLADDIETLLQEK